MIEKAVNSSNDIFLLNGKIATITGSEQVAQSVRTRLLTYLGEWFLDTTAGLPYFQRVFTKPANFILTEAAIKNEILRTEGVDKLLSFEFSFDRNTRILDISYTAITIFGEISTTLKMNQTTAEIQNG
jgi:hypothetical protein